MVSSPFNIIGKQSGLAVAPHTNKDILSYSTHHESGVSVTPTFIDKLTLTIDIPLSKREAVISRMMDDQTYRGPSKRYRHLALVPLNKKNLPHLYSDLSGQSLLRIEADSKDLSQNFMRFEWNPAKVDNILLPSVIEHFLPPLWTYQKLLLTARITRVDITFDVVNVSIDELLFYSVRKSCSAVWNVTKAKGGKTIYLGGERGRLKFSIYDKAELIRKNNSKTVPLLKEAFPDQDITRVELVYKPEKLMKLTELPEITNPFLDLQVFCTKPECGNESDLFKQTLARARYEGLSKALRALSKSNKTKLLELLKSCPAEWWDAEAVWDHMPSVISELLDPVVAADSS